MEINDTFQIEQQNDTIVLTAVINLGVRCLAYHRRHGVMAF